MKFGGLYGHRRRGIAINTATVFDRHAGGGRLFAAASAYEERFGTQFTKVVFFDAELLSELHLEGRLPDDLALASDPDGVVADRMTTITEIANSSPQTDEQRVRYLAALEDIYGQLAASPVTSAAGADLVIAPRREGHILAERIGCLPSERQRWIPQAKRISVDGGLLVGFDGIPEQRAEGRVTVVDGVIASGVTLMAALQLAVVPGAVVELFTCHATAAGVRALDQYADILGLRLTVHVGHVSGRLNERFYAVDPEDADRLVLGDIGDTISPVAQAGRVPR